MFENVGSKVSAIAIIYFVISLLAAIGGGILVWISVDHLGFLFFLLIVVGGFFISWIGALVLYAIGEAAENAETNAKLDQILQLLQNNHATQNTSASAKASTPTATSSVMKTASSGAKIIKVSDSDTTKQICPACGTKNDVARVFCSKCGARMS